MSDTTYPRMIFTDDGQGIIFRGHCLDHDELQKGVDHWQGPSTIQTIEEAFLKFVPRVKNCGDRYGASCDSDGEWHAHWVAVRSSGDLDTHFTIVYADTVRTPR
jgi:hypothetical protein